MAKPWYKVLEMARKLGLQREGGIVTILPFTAIDLLELAGFGDGKAARAEDIAAAWIGKLRRWGYLKRVGRSPGPDGRQTMHYVLTDWGIKFRPGFKGK